MITAGLGADGTEGQSMVAGIAALTRRQQDLLETWLPGAEVAKDHSWGLVGTTVLELTHRGSRLIAKAGDEKDRHLARELRAHRDWLDPLTSLRRAPHLVQADGEAKLLLTGYLPGHLVEGSDHERKPDTYRQAGELLARFHAQTAVRDEDFEARIQQKTLAWLDGSHRIDPDLVVRLKAIVRSWPTASAVLVPTHGDWQPRNWLVHDDVVSVIDFGRADLRPAMSDVTRLAAQQFQTDPALEVAFWAGYGPDPREPGAWQRHRLHEAILTAIWAYQVADEAFEAQGHRMIAEALPG